MIFDAKNLTGPVYDVDRNHMFNEIDQRIEGLKSLQGPTYSGIQREHNYFASLERNLAYLRELANPLYEIAREHNFIDLGQKLGTLKLMSYPVRENVDFSHHFNEIQQKVIAVRNLTGNAKCAIFSSSLAIGKIVQEAFIYFFMKMFLFELTFQLVTQ